MSDQNADSPFIKLQAINALVNELKDQIVSDQRDSAAFTAQFRIDSLPALGAQLNQRRKALNIDLATLELQTGLSASTLKRLFKDPEQVKFGSVYAVADALGVTLCAVV